MGGETCFLLKFLFLSILVFNIRFKYDRNVLGGFYIHIHVPMDTLYMKTYIHKHRYITYRDKSMHTNIHISIDMF
jgi:hypothetical protein